MANLREANLREADRGGAACVYSCKAATQKAGMALVICCVRLACALRVLFRAIDDSSDDVPSAVSIRSGVETIIGRRSQKLIRRWPNSKKVSA